MRRWPSSLGVAAAVALGGCALEPGQPWGEALVTAQVALDAPSDRLRDGRVRTSRDYAVRLDSVELVLSSLALAQRAEGSAGPTAFDPAAPPEGYSLCHNGHCHAADGRLVDYADIETELLGATANGPLTLMPVDARLSVSLDQPSARVSVSADLERGALTTLSASITALRLRGHVVDTRAARRLPEEGVTFDLELPLALRLVTPIEGRVGRDAPLRRAWTALVALPATLLDTADFAGPGLVAQDVEAYLTDAASLTLETTGDSL